MAYTHQPSKNQGIEDEVIDTDEFVAIKATCAIFYNALCTSSPFQMSTFWQQYPFCSSNLLQDCIGSAIVAMGPEKLLGLLCISLDAEDISCSNTWLITILKKNISGSSLGFFMSQIIPLAESFQEASCKDLQGYALGCWELLPAFCYNPSDASQYFGALAKLLSPFLKDSYMLKNCHLFAGTS